MNVFSRMDSPKVAFDIHPELIAMYAKARDGWIPPNQVSEEDYQRIKDSTLEDPALRSFVGFGCSFGGKYFGGYARGEGSNYADQASRGILKKAPGLEGATLVSGPYQSIYPSGALIYCDPPYRGTTGYKGTPAFDSDAFWDAVREWSQNNTVIVSEESAPDDFTVIWEHSQPRSLGLEAKRTQRTERLYKLAEDA